jgi:hypothetical protein
MSFIEAQLEILKGGIAPFQQKSQQFVECSKREKFAGMSSSSIPLENPELG